MNMPVESLGGACPLLGQRVVVTGMAGAGKSTFSRRLAANTGLELIHLDLYIWAPGWVRVPPAELLETQRRLMSADAWIIDSNDVDDDLLLQRADSLIILETPWWLCSLRAFRRGLRRPRGSVLPDGCDESIRQRIIDEWGIVWRNFRRRHVVPAQDRALAARCPEHIAVHVLSSKRDQAALLRRMV
ncbi:MAG: hypothetical protein AAF567_13720 [Actinomycetota bacterium]